MILLVDFNDLPSNLQDWLPFILTGVATMILTLLISALFRSLFGGKNQIKLPPIPTAEELADQIMHLPAFQNYIDIRVNAVKTAMEKVLNQYLPKIPVLEQEQAKLRQESSDLRQKITNLPKVDISHIEKILNQFNGRMNAIEQLPKTNDGIHVDPETFARWIRQHDSARIAIQEALNITLLQDTLVKLIPRQLQLKDLNALEQETLQRHWKLYKLNKEYIPQLKQEITKDLKQQIIKHFTP